MYAAAACLALYYCVFYCIFYRVFYCVLDTDNRWILVSCLHYCCINFSYVRHRIRILNVKLIIACCGTAARGRASVLNNYITGNCILPNPVASLSSVELYISHW